jgi:two-component system response regulator DesR
VIRVLIAEDTRAVRETVAALLGLEDDIEVAVAVASGDQVISAALAHRPDVALLDVGLPGTDGITAAAELAARVPACKVLILTGLDKPDSLAAALDAGVSGYLLKDRPASDLIGAIRAVARGKQVIDARLARPAQGRKQGPEQGREQGPAIGWPGVS